jgi:RimJ/RimL family protein N-acetyltransferase
MRIIDRISSPRLVLRRWSNEHRPAFRALHADREVMHDYPAPLTHAESDSKFERYRTTFDTNGFGRWAVELKSGGEFIGYVGIQPLPMNFPLSPGLEIGWRFCRNAWGHGYATEAARAALSDGFHRCGLMQVLTFTGATNARSEAVMKRLGMRRCPERDFTYPNSVTMCIVYVATLEHLSETGTLDPQC